MPQLSSSDRASMTASCTGKVALVVGGTRGIGRACAVGLGLTGATVLPAGRTMSASEAVCGDIQASGGKASASAFDVSDVAAATQAVDAVVERHGRIDILVANAGISPYWKRAEDLTVEMWDHVMAVNARGIFFCVQAAARHMLRERSGSIVSISSMTAVVGTPRGMPYTASKGAMDAMTRTLAVEWADRGVRVNGVAPGFISTDLTEGVRNNEQLNEAITSRIPLGRLGTPEEVAGLVVFLASDAGAFVTGQTYLVDGGQQAG